MERRLAAIVAADVVGYSRLMGEDEAGTLAELSSLISGTIEPLIAEHGGRVVKLMGDGILSEFASIHAAVECAVAWQEGLAKQNGKIAFRIGINLGDVMLKDGDIYGTGVNVAARLEALAEPGGICLSETVYREVKGKRALAFEDLGEQTVKNIAEPIHAYRLRIGATAPAPEAAAPLRDKPSIAVLPFTNMSGDPEQEFFSDGITEDIITELSRFPVLFVIARHSCFTFKNQTVNIKEVGEKLGVEYVLEGSVRRAGSRVRITAQLIEAETGNHVWAERYDRDLEDVFAVQDEVTKSIVGVLPGRVQENVAERAARKRPNSMKAYELMLQGKGIRDSISAEDTARAREFYEKAIELDPHYARPYMYLGDTYFVDTLLGLSNAETERLLVQLLKKAAELDGNDVAVQEMLGFAYITERRWDDADAQFDRTLAQIVNEAEQMLWCGYGLVMLGRHEEAQQVVLKSKRLDPLHPPSFDWTLGQAHFFGGEYEKAYQVLKGEALANSLAYACLASAHGHLGQTEQAGAALDLFLKVRHEEFTSRNLAVPGDSVNALTGGYNRVWRGDDNWQNLAEGLRKAGLTE